MILIKLYTLQKDEKITGIGKSEQIDDYIFSSEIGAISEPIEFNNKFHIPFILKLLIYLFI